MPIGYENDQFWVRVHYSIQEKWNRMNPVSKWPIFQSYPSNLEEIGEIGYQNGQFWTWVHYSIQEKWNRMSLVSKGPIFQSYPSNLEEIGEIGYQNGQFWTWVHYSIEEKWNRMSLVSKGPIFQSYPSNFNQMPLKLRKFHSSFSGILSSIIHQYCNSIVWDYVLIWNVELVS